MSSVNTAPSNTAISLESLALSPVQQFIQSELTALQQGELRGERQIKALFDLLPEGTASQIALAERLQLALLAEGCPLAQLPSLGIDIESQPDGSKTISYYEVIHPSTPLTEEQLNPSSEDSPLFAREVPMELLGTVRDARLVTPRVSVLSQWTNQLGAERVLDLIGDQSRLTYHNGLPITWDKNIDGKAWSTNIDTVYFSDWLREFGALNGSVKVSAEVGCGAGGISQAVLASCPNLTKHIYTDIDPNAINCARRNLTPLAGDAEVSWLLGKGIQGIVAPGTLDLLVTNPPYIPTPSGEGDKDHYSGTKLIKRLFEDGMHLLSPNNPDAAIYVQMSSVTLPDFARYRAEHPEVEVTSICTPVRVPLRISGLLREPEVLDFVTQQGGLEVVENDPLRYYHRIMAFRLKPRA
jgi:hypothetical protein